MKKNNQNKNILITGAGGSIGTELCKKILNQKPKSMILLDISEYAIYSINQELKLINHHNIKIIPIIGSIQDDNKLNLIFENFSIDTLYHAAAYKHVPLLELNSRGNKNNVYTDLLANYSVKFKVKNFILISTDKAVRPTNFMGASKRFSELICQSLVRQKYPNFSIVRRECYWIFWICYSIILKTNWKGGPVTVTHPEINRFFMTVDEAAELVIQASSIGKSGDVFVLIWKPIKIIDIAKTLIRLYDLTLYWKWNWKTNEFNWNKIYTFKTWRKLYELLIEIS